jgi:hypothetical protein
LDIHDQNSHEVRLTQSNANKTLVATGDNVVCCNRSLTSPVPQRRCSLMKIKLNLFTDFVYGFRREPLSNVVFYLMMAVIMIILSHFGSSTGGSLIFAVCFGLFTAIYISFSVRRFDIDQSRLTNRGRLGYLVSASVLSRK